MKKNTRNILFGFLAGAAAGTLAGILLAPDKGKNTRQNIATKAIQFKDDIGTGVQKSVEKLNSFKESAFSLINKYGEETRQSVNESGSVNNGHNL